MRSTKNDPSPDKIATDQISVKCTPGGNYDIVIGTIFPFVASRWGKFDEAKVAARKLQLWMMTVVIEDRKRRRETEKKPRI